VRLLAGVAQPGDHRPGVDGGQEAPDWVTPPIASTATPSAARSRPRRAASASQQRGPVAPALHQHHPLDGHFPLDVQQRGVVGPQRRRDDADRGQRPPGVHLPPRCQAGRPLPSSGSAPAAGPTAVSR
jgi:hypothetical protein